MRELIEITLIVVQLLVLSGGLLILTALVLIEVLDDFQRFQRTMSDQNDESSEPFDFEDWVQESQHQEQLYLSQLSSGDQRMPLALCLVMLVFSVFLLLGLVLYYSIPVP